MPERDLYLAAYDVKNARRLRASLDLVRGYATGGQKSVHECYLSPAEHASLLHDMMLVLEEEDRFLLLRLDPRSRVHTLGCAEEPQDNPYFYIG